MSFIIQSFYWLNKYQLFGEGVAEGGGRYGESTPFPVLGPT